MYVAKIQCGRLHIKKKVACKLPSLQNEKEAQSPSIPERLTDSDRCLSRLVGISAPVLEDAQASPGRLSPRFWRMSVEPFGGCRIFLHLFYIAIASHFPSFASTCEMPQSFHTVHFVGRDSLAGRFTSGGRRSNDLRPNSFVAEASSTRPAIYRDFVFRPLFDLPV